MLAAGGYPGPSSVVTPEHSRPPPNYCLKQTTGRTTCTTSANYGLAASLAVEYPF